MNVRIWMVVLSVFVFTDALARESSVSTEQQRNEQRTQRHYQQLISGSTPNLVGLTLFTTLMPKGGDLHHHYSGSIYAEYYLDWVQAQHYCIYDRDNPTLQIQKFRIEVNPQGLGDEARAQCLEAEQIRQNDHLYRALLSTWSDKDYPWYAAKPSDQQFFNTFGYFGPVSDDQYGRGLQLLKQQARDEHLGYLETMLKSSPKVEIPALTQLLDNPLTQPIEQVLEQAYQYVATDAATAQALEHYLEQVATAASGIEDEHFTVRFQSYVSRNSSPARVFGSLYTAFAAAARSPWVVGINMVGPENGPVALRDYHLHMQMLAFFRQRFPDVPLALHAGELTLGMVPPEHLRFHIREAVEIAGARRIGHGVDIAHESEALSLLRRMKQQPTAVEINLTSNAFILGVQGEAHPIQLYRQHGVPIVIATDDAGVSRSSLSQEYLLYTSRYKPTYPQLKETVYNSIRYSFLSDADKVRERARLDRGFRDFEALMAQHYPH